MKRPSRCAAGRRRHGRGRSPTVTSAQEEHADDDGREEHGCGRKCLDDLFTTGRVGGPCRERDRQPLTASTSSASSSQRVPIRCERGARPSRSRPSLCPPSGSLPPDGLAKARRAPASAPCERPRPASPTTCSLPPRSVRDHTQLRSRGQPRGAAKGEAGRLGGLPLEHVIERIRTGDAWSRRLPGSRTDRRCSSVTT